MIGTRLEVREKQTPDTWEMLILEQISNSRLARADSDLQEATATPSWFLTLRVLRQKPTDDMTGCKDRVDGGPSTMQDAASTEREIAQEVREGPRSSGLERRRHSRHRLGLPIQVWLEDGRAYPAMAFEMSESGMSAATTSDLCVGDEVDLSPVATYRVSAIVRRKTGSMYGFQSVELTEKQQKGIREMCKDLPLFRSMLDI
jgi:hypothetical protein